MIVAWDVYLNRKKIDTVFYSSAIKINAHEIKRSLVNHDGYDHRITVRKRRKAK
jgi:hypothetical protein